MKDVGCDPRMASSKRKCGTNMFKCINVYALPKTHRLFKNFPQQTSHACPREKMPPEQAETLENKRSNPDLPGQPDVGSA